MDRVTCQALLKHLPRRATLRRRKPHPDPHRRLQRDYSRLSQVCRQVRHENRPWHMLHQQVAIDLVDINKCIETFYSEDASAHLLRTGNLTIAIRDKITAVEKAGAGLNLWPLLSLWAKSYRVQANLGRYFYKGYDGRNDGESNDLYRIFCRQLQDDLTLGPCNQAWLSVLAGQKLAAVYLQRDPWTAFDPYIHILFKHEHKKPWMIGQFSPIPTGWLAERGFGNMEYFDIEVGGCNDITPAIATASTACEFEIFNLPTWCAVNSAASFKL